MLRRWCRRSDLHQWSVILACLLCGIGQCRLQHVTARSIVGTSPSPWLTEHFRLSRSRETCHSCRATNNLAVWAFHVHGHLNDWAAAGAVHGSCFLSLGSLAAGPQYVRHPRIQCNIVTRTAQCFLLNERKPPALRIFTDHGVAGAPFPIAVGAKRRLLEGIGH